MKRLICVCSALLFAACAVLGSDLTDFRDQVVAAETQEELQEVFDNAPDSIRSDWSYSYLFETAIEDSAGDWTYTKQNAIDDIDGRLAKEAGNASGEIADAKEAAGEILSNPIYVDPKQKDRNWIGDTGARLSQNFGEWLASLMQRFGDWIAGLMPRPSGNPFGSFNPSFVTFKFVVWGLLILAIGVVLFFILRHFAGVGRKRRVGGILGDDEPERTADQWLEQGERLEKEGKFREAVRCYYLACLVRFDDGGVARFRRHETNWEHLYRIEASPKKPEQIDFRHVTQRFDKIWYGHMIDGVTDVIEFKEVYIQLCELLGITKAA